LVLRSGFATVSLIEEATIWERAVALWLEQPEVSLPPMLKSLSPAESLSCFKTVLSVFLFPQKQIDLRACGLGHKGLERDRDNACSINPSTILYRCISFLLEELLAYKPAALDLSLGFSRPAAIDGHEGRPVSRTIEAIV